MWRALGGLCTGSGRAVGAHGARHIFAVFLINARRASQPARGRVYAPLEGLLNSGGEELLLDPPRPLILILKGWSLFWTRGGGTVYAPPRRPPEKTHFGEKSNVQY